MWQRIETWPCNCSLRNRHDKFRVDDRNLRRHFVVGQRILNVRVVIRNNRIRRNFGTGTRSCRDAEKFRVRAVMELDDSLADINEFLLQTSEQFADFFVAFKEARFLFKRVFIDVARNLGSIHCGTATDGNNGIRLEFFHLACDFHRLSQRRIRMNSSVKGCLYRIFACFKLIVNLVDEAEFNHSRIGNDHCAINVLRFVRQVWQGILFVVDFFW